MFKKNNVDKNKSIIHEKQNNDGDALFSSSRIQKAEDVGRSNHMTDNKYSFTIWDDPLQSKVKIGDDKLLQAKGKGKT